MNMTNELNWLITGASQGFGRSLTGEALLRGHTVIALCATRHPSTI